jgi:hypothetical protein
MHTYTPVLNIVTHKKGEYTYIHIYVYVHTHSRSYMHIHQVGTSSRKLVVEKKNSKKKTRKKN